MFPFVYFTISFDVSFLADTFQPTIFVSTVPKKGFAEDKVYRDLLPLEREPTTRFFEKEFSLHSSLVSTGKKINKENKKYSIKMVNFVCDVFNIIQEHVKFLSMIFELS